MDHCAQSIEFLALILCKKILLKFSLCVGFYIGTQMKEIKVILQ